MIQGTIRRPFSFSFVGPRNLDDILKKELIGDKSPTEVADIWYSYHEGKVGSVMLGYQWVKGNSILADSLAVNHLF